MATVVDTRRIDALLDQLLAVWSEVPEIACEIDSWSHIDQVTYAVEWPLYEGKLLTLTRHAQQGLLNEAQCERYAQLLRLIDQYRPLLDEMLR